MIRLSHETPNTTRRLVATMRIDRNRSLDETQQQTRGLLRLKSTHTAQPPCVLSKLANVQLAARLKLATDLALSVLSVLPMRLHNARRLVRRAIGVNRNASVQHFPVHAARESNFEVAVYLKMARKKKTRCRQQQQTLSADAGGVAPVPKH